MTTPFEDQVAVALRQRSTQVAIPEGGRAAIDRRLARRTRDRRVRRVGAAAALLVLLIGSFVLLHRGHDDAKVVTIPGVPVVHLPQLGLPPDAGTNRIGVYSPGRQVVVELQPTSSANPGGQLTVSVTDHSLTDVAHASGHWQAGESITLDGRPALAFPAIAGGPQTMSSVVWQPTDHVVAELLALNPTHVDQPPTQAALLAAGLVELDDASWSALLDPPDVNRAPSALGLFGREGHAELSAYAPTDATGGSGAMKEVLDVPGYAPGTFSLSTFFFSTDASEDLPVPVGSSGSTPATDGGNTIDVGGTTVYIEPEPGSDVPDDTPSQLIWNADRSQYRLEFPHAISPQDAATVVARLSVPTADQWHALLFPSTLRVDLVSMPEFRATDPTTATAGG